MKVFICPIILPTPWGTVLLKKVTVFQVVKKFPAFYGTRSFIAVSTSGRQLSLSRARSPSPCPPPQFLYYYYYYYYYYYHQQRTGNNMHASPLCSSMTSKHKIMSDA